MTTAIITIKTIKTIMYKTINFFFFFIGVKFIFTNVTILCKFFAPTIYLDFSKRIRFKAVELVDA